jgi:hypothetical protein
MQKFGRVAPVLTLVLLAGMDAWLASLRCESSPPIDVSRLGFCITLQVGIVFGLGWLARREGDFSAAWHRRLLLGMLAAAAFTFLLVRQPLLLSDTTHDKYFDSGSYSCPGVPKLWKPGL